MLDKYLETEDRKLERIGSQKASHQQRKATELSRLESLEAIHDSMQQPLRSSGLFLQNRSGIRDQITNLAESQRQEIALAEAEIMREQANLVRQFGRVKALQMLREKRAKVKNAREKRVEQMQADDWTSQSLRRA